MRSTGALGDLGSHLIDLTRWMFGEITNVSARISTQHDRKGVEPIPANDTALIDLVTHNAVCVSLFVSSAALLGEEKARVDVQVLGSAGSLEAQLIFYGAEAGSRLLRRTADHQVKVLLSESYTQGSEPPDFVAVYRSESAGPRAFIDAIIEGRGAKPDFFDWLEAQRVIDAALRSNHKGHRIDI